MKHSKYPLLLLRLCHFYGLQHTTLSYFEPLAWAKNIAQRVLWHAFPFIHNLSVWPKTKTPIHVDWKKETEKKSEHEERSKLKLQTCLRNSSRAISPWATLMTSLTMLSCLCKSISQMWPRVSSDNTQLTFSRFISCFQCLSFRASDLSSTTSTLTWTIKHHAHISSEIHL